MKYLAEHFKKVLSKVQHNEWRLLKIRKLWRIQKVKSGFFGAKMTMEFWRKLFYWSWQFHFSRIYDFQLKFNQQFSVNVISTLLCECMDFPSSSDFLKLQCAVSKKFRRKRNTKSLGVFFLQISFCCCFLGWRRPRQTGYNLLSFLKPPCLGFSRAVRYSQTLELYT